MTKALLILQAFLTPNNNTYKYHNKDTGEGQNNYKNSKEQENDLKITDELIEKEIENGSYD